MLSSTQLVAVLVALSTVSQAATTVDIPTKDLVGLSIEMDRWPSWASSNNQLGSPNTFFNQALGNLAALTGAAVPIRIGGGLDQSRSVSLLPDSS